MSHLIFNEIGRFMKQVFLCATINIYENFIIKMAYQPIAYFLAQDLNASRKQINYLKLLIEEKNRNIRNITEMLDNLIIDHQELEIYCADLERIRVSIGTRTVPLRLARLLEDHPIQRRLEYPEQ